MRVLWPSTLVALLFMGASGCTSKNPKWLDEPSSAFCAYELSQSCLQGLAEKTYSDASESLDQRKAKLKEQGEAKPGIVETVDAELEPAARQDATSATVENEQPVQPSEGEAVPASATADTTAQQEEQQPQSIEGLPQNKDRTPEEDAIHALESSLPKLAFGVGAVGVIDRHGLGLDASDQASSSRAAGALLHIGDDKHPGGQLAKINAISDSTLKAATLFQLLALYAGKMEAGEVDAALNELYELDRSIYRQALIVKLPVLLRSGDLERAKALRVVLLEETKATTDSFSMLAYVASCYTMAGLKQDAGAIVSSAVEGGAELTADDLKLINMAVGVANGAYPAMQEFYDYRSDDVRLEAYVTIAVLARQLGLDLIAHRAVGDAVKFVQKSSVRLNRPASVAQVLSVAPGLLK